jgi:hypothetical protein
MSSSPNTRLQRTRSRSPLSRSPLGSATLATLMMTLIVAQGCASVPKSDTLVITLADAAGGYPLSGVDVDLTDRATGKVYRATTDAAGLASFRGLAHGAYLVATPAFISREHLYPDHVMVKGGGQRLDVKVGSSEPGIYVGPGAA